MKEAEEEHEPLGTSSLFTNANYLPASGTMLFLKSLCDAVQPTRGQVEVYKTEKNRQPLNNNQISIIPNRKRKRGPSTGILRVSPPTASLAKELEPVRESQLTIPGGRQTMVLDERPSRGETLLYLPPPSKFSYNAKFTPQSEPLPS